LTKGVLSSHTRTDALNLTNIYDNITSANIMSLTYSPANHLRNADGAWGSKTFYYDGGGWRGRDLFFAHGAVRSRCSRRLRGRGLPAGSPCSFRAALVAYAAGVNRWPYRTSRTADKAVRRRPRAAGRQVAPSGGRQGREDSQSPACITTGTATTIRASAATRSPTRWGLWMGRVFMGMRGTIRIGMWIRMGAIR